MKTIIKPWSLMLKEKYKKTSELHFKTIIFAQRKLKTKKSNERFS